MSIKISNRMVQIFSSLFLSSILVAANAQVSDPVKSFRDFAGALSSGEGAFEQTVSDRSGRVNSRTTGTLQFAKPSKFKWFYNAPNKQQLIGNGKKVWIYDEDLRQVTVKAQDKTINAGPAALFAGQAELDAAFTLRAIGDLDGLQWIEATPKQKESGFEQVRIGIKSDAANKGSIEPARLELFDNFGNKTQLTFKSFKKNIKLTDDVFEFVVPKGVDVVGE